MNQVRQKPNLYVGDLLVRHRLAMAMGLSFRATKSAPRILCLWVSSVTTGIPDTSTSFSFSGPWKSAIPLLGPGLWLLMVELNSLFHALN